MAYKMIPIAPLNAGFMITAIVGFVISAIYLFGENEFILSKKWLFTFMLFFFLMFIASIISMTYAPGQPDLPHKIIKSK